MTDTYNTIENDGERYNMKCKFCDGNGKDYWCLNGVPYPCPVCNGTGKIKQTNKEYMDSCNSDELAEFLWKIVSEYILWDKMHEPQYAGNPKQAFIDWLKEEHNA